MLPRTAAARRGRVRKGGDRSISTPPPAAAAGHQPAPVLARLQELSKLTISTASSLESLTVTAKKAEAEPYLLQHLPAVLKATADKVRACLGA